MGRMVCGTWAAIRGCIPGGAGLGDRLAVRLGNRLAARLGDWLAARLPELLEASEAAAERLLRDRALERLRLRPGLQLWRPLPGLLQTLCRADERAKERNPGANGLADPSLCRLSRLGLEEGMPGVPRLRRAS